MGTAVYFYTGLLLQPKCTLLCVFVTYKEHVMVIISFFHGDDNLRM